MMYSSDRRFDIDPKDFTCRLRESEQESTEHFVVSCLALTDSEAPPTILNQFPDPCVNPVEFTNLILGVPWIEDKEFQEQLRLLCLHG